MTLKIALPDNSELRPKIIIMGVGGAGGNAVNNMIASNVQGADFWVLNTDAQALEYSNANNKIQLGIDSTLGLGAGANPEVGRNAAEESKAQIIEALKDSNMVFITAGMGGGTGTGAAPVIARIAKELGIMTVGVVTKPFHFEGGRRMKVAELGIESLTNNLDTLIIIPNQNLFRVANEKTTFIEAFKKADDVLMAGVRSITDLITMPGLINLDFADIKTIMNEMGKAMMGTGEADGEDRAIKAAEAAISNPILDNSSMKGARGVLINITGGDDMTLFEVDVAVNRIKQEVGADANIIFGAAFNPNLSGKIKVSVVATGIGGDDIQNVQYSGNVGNESKSKTAAKNAHTQILSDKNDSLYSKKNINPYVKTNTPVNHNVSDELELEHEVASKPQTKYGRGESSNWKISNSTEDRLGANKFSPEDFKNQPNNEINDSFNSNNFLAGKGFFIPPKASDPDLEVYNNTNHDADVADKQHDDSSKNYLYNRNNNESSHNTKRIKSRFNAKYGMNYDQHNDDEDVLSLDEAIDSNSPEIDDDRESNDILRKNNDKKASFFGRMFGFGSKKDSDIENDNPPNYQSRNDNAIPVLMRKKNK